MKKILLLIISLALTLNVGLVSAITPQEINEAKSLIDSKADCKSLSDSQLEVVGEYYMEQMHPGESHKLMHKMMGLEEGSESEKQFHINMAKRLYCNDISGISNHGMIGMMGGGMMNMAIGNSMMGYGMMGNYGYWSFLNILYLLLLIGLVIVVYLWIIKLWRGMQNKDHKK